MSSSFVLIFSLLFQVSVENHITPEEAFNQGIKNQQEGNYLEAIRYYNTL